jgi:hypothetical protein
MVVPPTLFPSPLSSTRSLAFLLTNSKSSTLSAPVPSPDQTFFALLPSSVRVESIRTHATSSPFFFFLTSPKPIKANSRLAAAIQLHHSLSFLHSFFRPFVLSFICSFTRHLSLVNCSNPFLCLLAHWTLSASPLLPSPWISFWRYSIPSWQITATQNCSLLLQLQPSHKASNMSPLPPSRAYERAQPHRQFSHINPRQAFSPSNPRNMPIEAPGPETPSTDKP